jgi:aryl-alcohol dehydrogenase-like predicted oxidoreductase
MRIKKIIGTEQLSTIDWGRVKIEENLKTISTAINSYGWKYVDTASVYDLGKVELLIGKNSDYFKNANLFSKVGLEWKKNSKNKRATIFKNCSLRSIIDQIEKSLERLDKKKIHTYYLHFFDKNLDIKKQLNNITEAKKRGYSDYCGVCNPEFSMIEQINNSGIDYVQIEMSLITNNIELIKKLKKKIILFSSLGRGLLTNNLKNNNYPKYSVYNDRRSRLNEFNKKNIELIKKFACPLLKSNINFSEVNLSFIKKYVNPNGIIIGFKNDKQFNEIKNFDLKIINKKNYQNLETIIKNTGKISGRIVND